MRFPQCLFIRLLCLASLLALASGAATTASAAHTRGISYQGFLVDSNGASIDGDAVVWESIAIISYLADRFPDKAIFPSGTNAARAHAKAISVESLVG